MIDLTITDIPAPMRRQIEAILRGAHKPVSDATVLDAYIEDQLWRQAHGR